MWVSRFLFVAFVLTLSVKGDGPTCSQSGLGPKDMMMSNGNMNPKYMWGKDGSGVIRIPVVLEHAYTEKERNVIFGGLAEMASKTCIKFYVYHHPEEVHGGDFVHITKSRGKGCWSFVGKQGGKQDLSLPRGCINHRTVMHEMMHALGFSHEHVRADRDKYVHILWENIQQGRERNFNRKTDSKSDQFGPYDYESIMHYERNAFSSNKQDTIRPLKGFVQIGKSKRMSHWDAFKINRAYKCHGSGRGVSNGLFGFGKFGYGHSHSENTPPVSFVPNQSFLENPFLPSERDPSNNNINNNNNNNEIESSDNSDDNNEPQYNNPFGGPQYNPNENFGNQNFLYNGHSNADYSHSPPSSSYFDDYYHPQNSFFK